jgi:CheY-like chemotaxis protein/AraC-like DNA-binding protein
MMNDFRARLFELIANARHFLWHVATTAQRSDFEDGALDRFVAVAGALALPSFAIKAVLLETVVLIDRCTGDRPPSLVDRFTLECHRGGNSLVVFAQCVREALKFRRVRHPIVQQAIAIIDRRYSESTLTSGAIADTLKIRQGALDVAFKRETGVTSSDYLRETRLARSLVLLVKSTKTIKEIWVEVGYNDPSTFDHHFKKHVGTTPTRYRRRAIMPTAPPEPIALRPSGDAISDDLPREGIVLVVDDDDVMRNTVAEYLRWRGHTVHVAADGCEALDAARRLSPFVILLDLHMPGMTGLECLAALRQQPNGKHPSVVIFTADWFVDELEEQIHALNATWSSKLCDPEAIHALVLQAGRQRLRSFAVA